MPTPKGKRTTPAVDPAIPQARADVLESQDRYTKAKLAIRKLQDDRLVLDQEGPVARASALGRLAQPTGPYTKTDAPKYLHEDAGYADFSARFDTHDRSMKDAECELSIARNLLYTRRLILASMLPGDVLGLVSGPA